MLTEPTSLHYYIQVDCSIVSDLTFIDISKVLNSLIDKLSNNHLTIT